MARRRGLCASTVGLIAALLAGCGGDGFPSLGSFNPPPLDIDAPIGGLTRASVVASTADLAACGALLSAERIEFKFVADQVQSETCRVEEAGVLGADLGVRSRLSPQRPMMTCRLAAALSVWRRQSVEPAARAILGADVVQIDHLGVYACRSVNNQVGARPSAHSRAAAIDIAGIRLTDGRRITVARDWTGDGPEAQFLRRIRDDACRIFGVTLGPDYNALHADHLHLEADGGRLCS